MVATGDDAPAPLAEKLHALGELAAGYGMAVDLEFMRFRRLDTLASALAVVRAVGRPNVRVLVDTLHLARAGGTPSDAAGIAAGMIGGVQLADAPAAAPPPDRLATEAREGRLLPSDGALPLQALLRALPPDVPLAAEVPLAPTYGTLDAPTRARRIHDATRRLIETTLGEGDRGRALRCLPPNAFGTAEACGNAGADRLVGTVIDAPRRRPSGEPLRTARPTGATVLRRFRPRRRRERCGRDRRGAALRRWRLQGRPG